MAKPLRKKLFYTSTDVARMCETDVKTIHMWAEKGRIVTFRTPGHHLRVMHDELVKFMAKYGYPLPVELTGSGESAEVPPEPDVAPEKTFVGVGPLSSRDPFHPPECDCIKCEAADKADLARAQIAGVYKVIVGDMSDPNFVSDMLSSEENCE